MALTPQDPHKAVITSVGSAVGGGTASSTKPVITGTADAGTTVDIFDGVRMIGTALVDSKGNWSFTPTADLKAGAHSFTAISVDSNGDMGASSTPMSVKVPSGTPVAPVKPVIDGGGPTDDTGHPLSNPTNVPRPEMSGTGTPGDTITMYDGNTPIGSTVIDGTGHWVVHPDKDLGPGNHDIYVIETNPAGVPSQPSDHYPVVIDTSVPAAPVITSLADDNGIAIPSGGATADVRPTMNGTGAPGDIVKMYDGQEVIGSAKVDGNGHWSITPTKDLSNAIHDLYAIETNTAGTAGPTSAHIVITIDTSVPATPAAPTLTDDNGATIAAGSTTSDAHPHISGTGAPGDTITIYDGSTVIGSTTIGGDGKWSFTPSPDLGPGSHDIHVIDTNAAGTSSLASDSIHIDIGWTPPGIWSVVGASGPLAGGVDQGGITTDGKPVISGTGHAGGIINVYDGTVVIGSTVVNSAGQWSFSPSANLGYGAHNVHVTETKSGVTSASSPTYTFTTQYSAITSVTDAGGHAIANGGVGQGTLTVTVWVDSSMIGGFLRPQLSSGGSIDSLLGKINIPITGNPVTFTIASTDHWTGTPAASFLGGTFRMSGGVFINGELVSIFDANTSTGWNVTDLFGTPTVLPAGQLTAVKDERGSYLSSGIATIDARPTITGRGNSGDTIKIYDGGTLIGSTTIDAFGNWSFKPTNAFSVGTHTLTTTETNSAGTSPASSSFSLVVTAGTAPAQPSVPVLVDDSGAAIPSGSTTFDGHPHMSGTATAGDLIKVYDGSVVLGSVLVGSDGQWSFTPKTNLSNGTHDLYVIDTNAAGTPSAASVHTSLVVDVSTAYAPGIWSVVGASGPLAGGVDQGGITTDGKPVISGTGHAGGIINVYDGTVVIGSTVVNSAGQWSFSPSANLGYGAHNVHVTETKSGVTSASSPTYTFTTQYSAITSVTDAGGHAIANGGVGQGTLTVTVWVDSSMIGGFLRPQLSSGGSIDSLLGKINIPITGNPVTFTIASTDHWTGTPAASFLGGTFRMSGGVFINGELVSIFDANTSTGWNVTDLFGTPTVLPAGQLTAVKDERGSYLSSGIATIDARPTITGRGNSGDTIKIYDGGTLIGSTTIDAFGNWSFKPTNAFSVGTHTLTTTETNSAGTSPASSSFSLVVTAGTAPAQPSVPVLVDDSGAAIPSGSTTFDGHPHMSGTATAGDLIKVYDGSVVLGSVLVGSDGQWSFTPKTNLSNGTHDLYVIDTNAAGTPSAASVHTSLVVDVSTAYAPGIWSVVGASGPLAGGVDQGGITTDGKPVISGTGHAGGIINVYDGTVVIGSTVVNSAGQWSFSPSANLGYGAHNVHVTETKAGVTSASSPTYTFTTNYSTVMSVTDSSGHAIANGGVGQGTLTVTVWVDSSMIGGILNPSFVINNMPTSVAAKSAIPITGNLVTFTMESTDLYDSRGATTMEGGTYRLQGDVVVGGQIVSSYGPSSSTGWAVTDLFATPRLPYTTLGPNVKDELGSSVIGGTTIDARPTVWGFGNSGDIIKIFDNGNLIGSVTINNFGQWSFKPTTAFSVGSHSLSTSTTNSAGTNVSTFFTKVVVAAGTAPAQPSAPVVVDDSGAAIPSGSTTSDGHPHMSGTATAGDLVKVYDGAAVLGSVLVGSDGHWSFTPKTNLSNGAHDLYVIDTNAAGTSSAASVHTSLVVGGSLLTSGLAAMDLTGTTYHTIVSEHDAFIGASANGNETVDLNADPSTYFKEAAAHIEGAKHGAIDTLHLTGDHQVLDLTSLTGKTAAAKISGIEVVDLGGQHNTLKLSLIDVLNLGETDLFQKDGKQQMMVRGKDGDTVDLSNTHIAGLADGEWAAHGTAVVGGVTYNVYEHSGAHTELLVQQGVQIVVH